MATPPFVFQEGESYVKRYRIALISFLLNFVVGGLWLLPGLGMLHDPVLRVPAVYCFLVPGILAITLPFLLIHRCALHLTNKRLILKTGILGQNYYEIDLVNIQNLSYKKSALGGLFFNYGNIFIVTAGTTITDQIKFPSVHNPEHVIASIKERMMKAADTLSQDEVSGSQVTAAAFCPKCGSRIDSGDQFCRACGVRL